LPMRPIPLMPNFKALVSVPILLISPVKGMIE